MHARNSILFLHLSIIISIIFCIISIIILVIIISIHFGLFVHIDVPCACSCLRFVEYTADTSIVSDPSEARPAPRFVRAPSGVRGGGASDEVRGGVQ